MRQPLAGIGNRPSELHKGHINIDPASVYTAAAIDADIRALSCTAVSFAAVEDDAHVTPVLKLSAQLFISIQPATGDDEDEHVSNPRSCALRSPVVVTVTWAAAELAVSVGAVAVYAWASGAAGLARSCGVASLQGFDVIRDPSCAGLHPSADVGVTL